MALNSLEFLLFSAIAAAVYYLIPGRVQWIWLLVCSYIYYLSQGPHLAVYLLFTTLTTFGGGWMLEKISDKQKKRWMVAAVLLLNFGMLAVLKYTNFLILNFNKITGGHLTFLDMALPLGISFYTFQSMGYLLDVYWKRCQAEKNPFRFALFVAFFPQLLQGPIGRYSRLASQLFERRRWDWEQMERGVQLILWGFFKKMVLADTAAPFVSALFDQYETYSGLGVFAVLAYSVQLYGDFSGGIDVVSGIALLFGISLDENFRRPYFARSITDFWHRWHITLGTWMKDYVFYPVSLSRWMGKFGKFSRKVFGRSTGRTLPICLANLIVFFLVGVWHGAAWKYIVYGMYNGLLIAFSGLMAANFRKWKKTCRINDKKTSWQIFQIARTFLLVNISWFFDRADTVGQALRMMKNTVTRWEPSALLSVPVGSGGTAAYTALALGVLLTGCVHLFAVSFFQERGRDVFAGLAARPPLVRLAVYGIILFAIPVLGQYPASTGGFIYAQF